MQAATFDLRTGVGRVPDSLDYITKRTACYCAPPGTPHPLWSVVGAQGLPARDLAGHRKGWVNRGWFRAARSIG
jgi:hypothetical protein